MSKTEIVEASVPSSGGSMTANETEYAIIDKACEQACAAIAPAWPLDRSIAVNPHWGRIQHPLRHIAARMAVLGNIQVFPSRNYIRQAWEKQRITKEDLQYALETFGHEDVHENICIEALNESPNAEQLPLLIDLLDDNPARDERLSWRQAITHQVSQTCAAYFDHHQADWQPDRSEGLYAFWRDTLTHDHGIGVLMGLPEIGKRVNALPATRQEAEQWAMRRLSLPQQVWADYLESVLLTVNGWASWCAYLGWQARLAGKRDEHLRDLLAIRLAWGAVLLECKADASATRAFSALQNAWAHAAALIARAERSLWVDEVWQFALDAGYQRQLASRLSCRPGHLKKADAKFEVQAVFCIDVRSERLRRAVEAVWPGIQTFGFAGFFGLPVAYQPLATAMRRPQLPGLLAPSLNVSDCISTGNSEADLKSQLQAEQARLRGFSWSEQWESNSRWPGAAFSFVEAAGFGYLGKLSRWLSPSTEKRQRDDLAGIPSNLRDQCRPKLMGLDTNAKVNLAARVLHALGLERDLAPIVLLVGHGSQSANNAHAAGLDCGACCGQTGEVNARALAQLLNEPEIRAGLSKKNVVIPPETEFIAALHNTTTDEVEWFDLDLMQPASHERMNRLQSVVEHACDQVRRERAASLDLNPREEHAELLKQFRRRANDGAQTRPEWGLGGNASFIIAPRHRTRGVVLDGRAFLHDYVHENDTDGSILQLLMTAPMLVTNWINWQYHASTCAPQTFGSGNKVLHNVVGGHIGVFEGNGGDLRIGISRQSLHDGKQWMHEPLRLTVIIDAPAVKIEAVIERHEVVRHLLENSWLHLWRFSEDNFERYSKGRWIPCRSVS